MDPISSPIHPLGRLTWPVGRPWQGRGRPCLWTALQTEIDGRASPISLIRLIPPSAGGQRGWTTPTRTHARVGYFVAAAASMARADQAAAAAGATASPQAARTATNATTTPIDGLVVIGCGALGFGRGLLHRWLGIGWIVGYWLLQPHHRSWQSDGWTIGTRHQSWAPGRPPRNLNQSIHVRCPFSAAQNLAAAGSLCGL